MVRQEKEVATKPENLTCVARSHTVKERSSSLRLSCDLHTHSAIHTPSLEINISNNSFEVMVRPRLKDGAVLETGSLPV